MNQRSPSGPSAIWLGSLLGVIPVENSVTSPTRAADALAEPTNAADKQKPVATNSDANQRNPAAE